MVYMKKYTNCNKISRVMDRNSEVFLIDFICLMILFHESVISFEPAEVNLQVILRSFG